MSTTETVILHGLAPSPPCLTVERALQLKGIAYERIDFQPGPHVVQMEALYGEGRTTVPGLTIGDERIHGSTAILPRLEEFSPEVSLYPAGRAEAVREAELWGEQALQGIARRLPWGALHFRPESLGTFGGAGPLDGPGTDFAIKLIHGSWRYNQITAAWLQSALAELPPLLEHAEQLIADGTIGGGEANAADLQIAASLRVMLTVGDLLPLIEGRPTDDLARRWFPDYAGLVPVGAFPAGWVPQR